MTTEKTREFYLSVRNTDNDMPVITVTSSKIAAEFIRDFYFDDIDIYESFFILLLNSANKTIGWAKISQGGVCSTVVDPKIVFKFAIESLATAIIICHNHPGQNTKPSQHDLNLTNQIKGGAKLLDILLFDHIIISSSHQYYSMADNGDL